MRSIPGEGLQPIESYDPLSLTLSQRERERSKQAERIMLFWLVFASSDAEASSRLKARGFGIPYRGL